jgi:hypothetical protein
MLFPEQACWGSNHIAVGLIAIILLIFFSVFSLFTGLTYYEFDPSIINAYPLSPPLPPAQPLIEMTNYRSGRLQNRFEFGALWVKMLLVFINYFLKNYPIVFAVVLFCSAVALFVSWAVMMPAYDRKLNMAVQSLSIPLPIPLSAPPPLPLTSSLFSLLLPLLFLLFASNSSSEIRLFPRNLVGDYFHVHLAEHPQRAQLPLYYHPRCRTSFCFWYWCIRCWYVLSICIVGSGGRV